MTTENLHQFASDATPSTVEIPKTYTGLIIWAVGKWGIGIVFAAFLIPVYSDLKASNQRLADISQANVQILTGQQDRRHQPANPTHGRLHPPPRNPYRRMNMKTIRSLIAVTLTSCVTTTTTTTSPTGQTTVTVTKGPDAATVGVISAAMMEVATRQVLDEK